MLMRSCPRVARAVCPSIATDAAVAQTVACGHASRRARCARPQREDSSKFSPRLGFQLPPIGRNRLQQTRAAPAHSRHLKRAPRYLQNIVGFGDAGSCVMLEEMLAVVH